MCTLVLNTLVQLTGIVYPCTVNWFCVHFKQPNLGNIQFWGQTNKQTHTLTFALLELLLRS